MKNHCMHYYCTICSRVQNCILKITISIQYQIFSCRTTSIRNNFYTKLKKKNNNKLHIKRQNPETHTVKQWKNFNPTKTRTGKSSWWWCQLSYTGCNRRNVPYFGRVFLMLNYTEKTQNTYIQSWTVTEILAREVWNFDSCYSLIYYQIHIETGSNMWFL
jgi:hypothetical protein